MKMTKQRLMFVGATLSIGSWAIAAGPATQGTRASELSLEIPPPPAPESVDEELLDAATRPPGILKYGPVSILDSMMQQLNAGLDPYGLKLGFAYTALYQAATGGPGQR